MSFISSKKCERRFAGAKYVSNIDILIKTNSCKIKEGFTFPDLENLREELQSVIDDIDSVIEMKNEMEEENE